MGLICIYVEIIKKKKYTKIHKNNTSRKYEDTIDLAQVNFELEVQLEYYKQAIKAQNHEAKKKDYHIKCLLSELKNLKVQIKEKVSITLTIKPF